VIVNDATPVNETPDSQGSFEDNFSEYEVTQKAFDETPAQEPAQPETVPQEAQPQQQPSVDNDQVRYEYWQSEAAKAQNRLKEMEQLTPMVEYIKANPQVIEAVQKQQQQPQEEELTFPEAPVRPEKPRSFSREEAFSDPASDSARYLDEVDDWREKMDQYNALGTQFQIAKMQEEQNKKWEAVEQQRKVQEAREQEARTVQNINKYVQEKHGLSPEETQEFVTKFSDPSSINMDNLVQLYRMQKGQAPQAPPPQPSQTFQQQKAAQQIPSPMGVVPAVNQQTEAKKSAENEIMDLFITNHKNKQAF
tara:strand:+ start:765 stop:1685 length:921 start_codon:yes stop_codon:yes gene_type:complete